MAKSTKDFEELLECLTPHAVRFVVVGAHAVAHHAKPRYTKDLDLFVEPDPEEFGFADLELASEEMTASGGTEVHSCKRVQLLQCARSNPGYARRR